MDRDPTASAQPSRKLALAICAAIVFGTLCFLAGRLSVRPGIPDSEPALTDHSDHSPPPDARARRSRSPDARPGNGPKRRAARRHWRCLGPTGWRRWRLPGASEHRPVRALPPPHPKMPLPKPLPKGRCSVLQLFSFLSLPLDSSGPRTRSGPDVLTFASCLHRV